MESGATDVLPAGYTEHARDQRMESSLSHLLTDPTPDPSQDGNRNIRLRIWPGLKPWGIPQF